MARCSILIPAYNNTEQQKLALIDSINQQTAIQDIQVILIDDGSELKLKWTSDFLSKHLHCQYKFFKNKENQGVGFSRNRIFNTIDTDYFCFLDSDDSFYDNTIIERYIAFLDSQLNYDAVRSLIYSDFHETISPIETLADSLNIHGLCGRTEFFKKHHINFPLTQYNEDGIFMLLCRIYQMRLKVLNIIGYRRQFGYLTQNIDDTIQSLNNLNDFCNSIKEIANHTKYYDELTIEIIVSLLTELSSTIKSQNDENYLINFRKYNIPKEIYFLWQKYYYLTVLYNIPVELLQQLKEIFTLQFKSLDYTLIFYMQDILMNRNLFYDDFFNEKLTYEEIETRCRLWLQSYIEDNPSIVITPQILKNFPWHYRSFN